MSDTNNLREVAPEQHPAPDTPQANPGNQPSTAAPSQARKGSRRFLLMTVLPTVVVATALYAYLQAGGQVSTDNAYVKGHIINLAPEVSGAIIEVGAREYQHIPAGAELIHLNDRTYRISRQRAQANLDRTRSEIDADKLAYQQAVAEIELYRTSLEFAKAQYARQVGLRDADLGTRQDLDTARFNRDTAKQQIEVARQQAASLLARLNGNADIPVGEHPRYLEASAELAQAELNLEHTIIRAPIGGVVTNRPEPGDYVEQGVPVLAVVADTDLWIEANFKETQLTHVREGQSAEVRIDAYPGKLWHGSVQNISEATGAEFALLPPQNATGNWVKIVQRIPVRIAIEDTSDLPPLRLGMSSTVTVDTGYTRTWRDLTPAG